MHPQDAGGGCSVSVMSGESRARPFPSLGLSFPIRAMGWMALKVSPISGCVAEGCESGWFGEAGGLCV